MKTKLTLLLMLLFCYFPTFSQTKQEVFSSIQKLISKTEGQKVKSNNVFAKKDDKLGKQVFNEKVISVNTIPEGKSKYEWVSRASEISWNDYLDYLIYSEYNNVDLQVVRLNFNKSFKEEHFTNDNDSDTSPSTTNYFQFYILTSDEDELIQLLKRLESLKEKKAESEFNKEIAKFSKEQTISWLTEKLKRSISGDSYTTTINLVNLDACNLVFEYSNMVGRKYRETIPTDIASINKYNQFTYNDDICLSKSFAFGIIQEENETTYKNKSFLNINTKDDDLISNITFAMKHLAGYCHGTHSTKNTESTADNSNSKKNEDSNVNNTSDLIDIESLAAVYNEMNKYTNSLFIGNSSYTIANATDFANFLNKNCYAALHWQGENRYQFEEVGKTDFSKKSVEFTVKNNRLHIKANIPLNGNCDYGLKEFPVVDSDISETRETADTKFYYFTLNFKYECNGVNYKYLTVFIEDKTLSSYAKVKELFATYGKS
ncbi:MAG: hypothetical protein ACOH1N_08075 [Lutibacter sp.]